MPRPGDSTSHNAVEAGHDIIHGAGPEESTRVSRADKTAPLPEHSKGAGIQSKPAGAGHSQGKNQGGRGSKN
ncbi:hypothetical protein MYCTH_2297299 [Thermothelomyces thermophilus ATCC 42464]|uniref:Uncharacterized protein n=1 Tax=Thermothelomyces thermophilus (strain ATCC 42464 / BCRC 31852 / DSM 1799) TaxID=573729 RepID=G2Q549_THET4|nr:uncharacterized protein MYCTH_2297299 [Thermothelomyces thermophilus ATCC 42464]AEO54587.1 hypothetical protein MYCTH_2297299 [Thermothelomyces thermophilus ATCC 42464]